jgi:hypothetical protein
MGLAEYLVVEYRSLVVEYLAVQAVAEVEVVVDAGEIR